MVCRPAGKAQGRQGRKGAESFGVYCVETPIEGPRNAHPGTPRNNMVSYIMIHCNIYNLIYGTTVPASRYKYGTGITSRYGTHGTDTVLLTLPVRIRRLLCYPSHYSHVRSQLGIVAPSQGNHVGTRPARCPPCAVHGCSYCRSPLLVPCSS